MNIMSKRRDKDRERAEPLKLCLDSGIEIPKFTHKDPYSIINNSIYIFGQSGTGKSSIVNYLLLTLQGYVSSGFVICPTEATSETPSYKGVFPPHCIKTADITDKSIEKCMIDLYNRQEFVSAMAKCSSNITLLRELSKRFGVYDSIHRSLLKVARVRGNIEKLTIDADKKKKVLADLKQYEINLYSRKLFDLNKAGKIDISRLSEDEANCIQFLYFNPRTILILDDCFSTCKKVQKTSIFIKYLTQCRHFNVTFMIIIHAVQHIAQDNRLLSKKSIFSDKDTATKYFGLLLSGGLISNGRHRMAMAMIDKVFEIKFRPFIYSAEASPATQLQYFVSRKIPPTPFGSKHIWKLSEKAGVNDTVNKTNPYYQKFMSKRVLLKKP